MKKKSFVLSWGRKMFFGLGWALTCIMALNYFQSMIIPHSTTGWAYFLTTFIGHYGLILSLVYFFLYVPVISVFPSYYISRVWSIVLILSINLFIFFDSYLFARYRFHINSFLWNLLKEPEALTSFGLTPVKLGTIGAVAAIIFITFWVRGERLWRSMQARFSNPTSNWYFAVIFLCLVTSHLMYMFADAKGNRNITRLSNIFPLHFTLTGKGFLRDQGIVSNKSSEVNQGYKDFFYPSQALACPMKQPKNVLLIVLDKLNEADLNETQMPNLFHFASHGQVFKNHYSGGVDKDDGYFSLLYALSPTYLESVLNQTSSPVFLTEFKKNKHDMTFFQYGGKSPLNVFQPEEKEISLDYIESHLAERDDLAVVNPFLMQVYLQSTSETDKDNNIRTVVDLFIKHKLISNTIIVITGTHSNEIKTPLVLLWPNKGRGEVTKLTTHYDILPTIMKEDWKCKNPVTDFSSGASMFSETEKFEHVVGDYEKLKIIDTNNQTLTSVSTKSGVEVRNLATSEVISRPANKDVVLGTLERLTKFYKRQ